MPFEKTVDWQSELPQILALGRSGESIAAIARRYGVSRQRMKQLVDKFFPNWKYECSYTARAMAREEAYKHKWGLREGTDLYRSKRTKWRNKKYNALAKGIPWDLEFSDIEWPTHCPALGIELDYFAESVQDSCVSFDRIDPSKGYVKGNVIILSSRANRIKNNATYEDLQKIAHFLQSLTCQEEVR